jgi:dTDP-4-amino-4,6-dideoxygalactose transaminase
MSAALKPQPPVAAYQGGIPLFAQPLRFIVPTLPDLDAVVAEYRRAYDSGQITNGDIVRQVEQTVAERLGVKHCVAVSSCTSGLTLTMRAMDLQGEVILPSLTFFATGHAALWNGLRPVLADCEPETWTLDPVDVERRITPRTSAIVGVHLYGNPCAIEELTEVAARHGLKLLLDAAHAFGSRYKGRPVGQFGDAEVFSLSPTKTLVAGEGGFVTTNDGSLARRLRAGRNYGDAGTSDCEMLGMNARMSEFQAALALAGLPLVDSKVKRQNRIAQMYSSSLAGIPGVSFPNVHASAVSTFKDFCLHIDADAFGLTRDKLIDALRAENIEARRYFYPPLHRQELYRQFVNESGPPLAHTERISNGIVSLPIYDSLSDQDIESIIWAIKRIALGVGRFN